MVADILLTERARQGRPIRVGLIGAGVAARAIALHLVDSVPGIRLVGIANRTVANARRAWADAGTQDVTDVSSPEALDRAIERGRPAVTGDADVLCESAMLDILVEATGTVEHAARIVSRALERGKHVVLANAELDATIGPLLAIRAREHGVVLTNTDGDEPGVAMTLLRYLRSIGLRPVAAGNLKGLVDHYRTPDTQRAFADRYGQNPKMATSFADATKLSMEATVLANATAFRVGQRGMYGPACDHVREVAHRLPADEMLSRGLVDYALGAAPYTGAFVVVFEEQPLKRALFEYGKLGDGPFYVFYTPFHLQHVQIASTIARVVLEGDATVTPLGAPVCETVTVAKRDLPAGTVLDGIGGFCAYGLVDNADQAQAMNAVPMGLSEGCRLVRAVKRDDVVSYADVEVPTGRSIDTLRAEQARLMDGSQEPTSVDLNTSRQG
jgi:predicted homoserine dehydrogenase-like protein